MTPRPANTLRLSAFAAALLGLSACGLVGGTGIVSRPEAAAREAAAAGAAAPATGGYVEALPASAAPASVSGGTGLNAGGQTAAQLDQTTAAERAAATAAPAATGGRLGTTVASLGDATESGFWIKTPLVSAPGKGRLVDPASGKSVNVDLQPLGGGASGSQISLAVMQTLGVALTDLPQLEVWQN